jgi:hypothetical protein
MNPQIQSPQSKKKKFNSLSLHQIEYFMLFYNSLFWTFTVLALKLLYFDSYIKYQDKLINQKQATIFTRFRKILKSNQQLTEIELDKLKKDPITKGSPRQKY